MLSETDAIKVVKAQFPENAEITKPILYGDLYVFRVYSEVSDSRVLDPFFSVSRETGEFRDFSVITDVKDKTFAELAVKSGW